MSLGSQFHFSELEGSRAISPTIPDNTTPVITTTAQILAISVRIVATVVPPCSF